MKLLLTKKYWDDPSSAYKFYKINPTEDLDSYFRKYWGLSLEEARKSDIFTYDGVDVKQWLTRNSVNQLQIVPI